MRHVNALELRQSLGKTVDSLRDGGEPIMLDKGNQPVAVLISLKDFQERFVEKAATEARRKLLKEMDELVMNSIDLTPSEDVLHDLRRSRNQ